MLHLKKKKKNPRYPLESEIIISRTSGVSSCAGY